MVETVVIVAGFGTSTSIANAYGVAVAGVTFLTTLLFSSVLYHTWKLPPYVVLPFLICFVIIDSCFFAANLIKVPKGGWVSILIGVCFSMLMFSWLDGQLFLKRYLKGHRQDVSVEEIQLRLKTKSPVYLSQPGKEEAIVVSPKPATSPTQSTADSTTTPTAPPSTGLVKRNTVTIVAEGQENRSTKKKLKRFPRMGIFVSDVSTGQLPQAFLNMIDCIYSIPDFVVFLTVETSNRPTIPKRERLAQFTKLGDNMYQINAKFGFADYNNNIKDVLRQAQQKGLPVHDEDVTYFLSNQNIKIVTKSPIHFCALSIFSVMAKIFPNKPKNFVLPQERTVEIASLAFLK